MNLAIAFVVLSLLLYGIAQALPCLLFEKVPKKGIPETQPGLPTGKLNAYGYPDNLYEMRGGELTITGLFGLLVGAIPPAIGWLANPSYWISCIFLVQLRYTFSLICALVAVFLGFAGTVSAFWFRLPNGSNPSTDLALSKLLLGFWLWLAAPCAIALVNIVLLNR